MSNFLNLNWKDFFKGLIVAVLTAVITIIYSTIQAGSLAFDLKAIGMAALSACLAYLVKNFFQNSNGNLLKSEGTQPVDPNDPRPR